MSAVCAVRECAVIGECSYLRGGGGGPLNPDPERKEYIRSVVNNCFSFVLEITRSTDIAIATTLSQ